MTIASQPHYRISSVELAKWLDDQGDEFSWGVDGDPLLMRRLPFPCISSQLSGELRRIDKMLLIRDTKGRADSVGQLITAAELNDLVKRDQMSRRYFNLDWEAAAKKGSWIVYEYGRISHHSSVSRIDSDLQVH